MISTDSEREAYWRDQILGLDIFPVLFVCGAKHVEGFSALLAESQIPAEIIARDWGSAVFEEEPNQTSQPTPVNRRG